jgi:hypothetical protein
VVNSKLIFAAKNSTILLFLTFKRKRTKNTIDGEGEKKKWVEKMNKLAIFEIWKMF